MDSRRLSQLRAAARRGDPVAVAELLEMSKTPAGLKQLHSIAAKNEAQWLQKKKAEFKGNPPKKEGQWEQLQKRRNVGYVPIVQGGAPGLGKKK